MLSNMAYAFATNDGLGRSSPDDALIRLFHKLSIKVPDARCAGDPVKGPRTSDPLLSFRDRRLRCQLREAPHRVGPRVDICRGEAGPKIPADFIHRCTCTVDHRGTAA